MNQLLESFLQSLYTDIYEPTGTIPGNEFKTGGVGDDLQ